MKLARQFLFLLVLLCMLGVSAFPAGVAAQATDQCFGTYSGTVVPDDGRTLTVDGIAGWAEEATWRW